MMGLDINAKLPIIRAENLLQNGLVEENNHHHHSQQNGLTIHHPISDDGPNKNNCNNNNIINNNNNNNNDTNHQLDLPKPSFRIAENFRYKRRANTISSHRAKKDWNFTKDSYYHYEEPSPSDLMNTVEYDMDQEDVEWLQLFNIQNAGYNYEISESDFERIMDRLEKESYFESKSSGREVVPEVDEDAVCAICNDGDCQNTNVILFCDMCDLAVHQECYGVPYIPEGQWLCRRCLQSPSRNVDCELCPNKGGAFKQTDNNKWAHVICALWVPEVCFANTVFLEPIDSIDQIPPARWKLTCYICKQKKRGACIQCHKANCYVPFHVTCAQQAGLHMRISTHRYSNPDGSYVDVKKEAFCDAHTPSDRGRKGQGMYSDGDSDNEDFDSQAFKKRQRVQREKMKKTRKILAEKREIAFNPVAEPKVQEDKLIEISKLLSVRGRRKNVKDFENLRREFIRKIEGYWLMKRKNRNGVPLLRRLQVSYNNNTKITVNDVANMDCDKYSSLRHDLEKARLLVGQVKRRELLKKKLFKLSKDIIGMRYQIIDNEDPPIDGDMKKEPR